MRERQRWRPEEDAVLREYVRQHGPREWHLVSQRMRVVLDRDAKSCLERWKNYLRPGIKKGSLSEEEQRLVILLQAKHGNKWKRIAAEVPGRTAKRLGKWWEVFKEKQLRREARSPDEAQSTTSYDWLLETFAEKLVGEQLPAPPMLMAPAPVLPPWLAANSNNNTMAATTATTTPLLHRQPSPSVTLSLASSAPSSPQPDYNDTLVQLVDVGRTASELVEWCREAAEGHRAWVVQRKEAAWRLRRVEAQLEAERERRRRQVAEEFEARARALREQREATMERVEAEHREQVAVLRRDAEAKEEKMAEHWAAKHARLTGLAEQLSCRRWPPSAAEMSGR